MKALDLFCGAGGAGRGLADAGFDVVGVDLEPQPNYPFEFHQSDALAVLTLDVADFDFVWASPPCQRYMTGGQVRREDAPDLIGPVRQMLEWFGVPWVIENVSGAPLRADAVLCGSHFGLTLKRVFEASYPISAPRACDHRKPIVGVYGHPHGKAGAWPGMLPSTLATWRSAMGIDWMTARELSQAIPPAYSAHLATQFLGI